MALRYLETFHGFATASALVDDQFQTQPNTYLSGNSRPDNQAGRFSGQRSIGTTSTNVLGDVQVEQSFAASDNVRVAIDFKRQVGDAGTPAVASFHTSQISPVSTSVATNTFCYIRHNPTTEKFQLEIAESVQATSANTYTVTNLESNYHRVEVELNVDGGTCRVWVNDSLEINATGLNFSGTTGGSSVGSIGICGVRGAFASLVAIWDDTGSTGFTGVMGDFKPIRLLPNGVGSQTDSTPTGAATAWEATDDSFANGSTDYTSLIADGAKDFYAYSDVGETGDVITVVAQPAIFKNALGDGKARALVKYNGVEAESVLNSVAFAPLSDSYGQRYITATFDVNPDTGLAWTVAEVDGAEFGVKAEIDTPS